MHRHHVQLPVVHRLARQYGKNGMLVPAAGAEANATTVAGPDETDTAARPSGTTDEADAGTRSPDVSLGSGAVVEHDGAVSVSGTPQQAVFQQ